jgi:hypothetical protein
MYIHQQFIKEEIGASKQALNGLSFFLLLKNLVPNSIIYDSTTYVDISRWTGLDRRTVKKYFEYIQMRGWARKYGNHVLLRSLEKDYEYRQKENGKADKKRRSKFYRIQIKDKYRIKNIRSIIRGLMPKEYFKKAIYSKLNDKQSDQICKKEKAKLLQRGQDFRTISKVRGEKLAVPMGIGFIAKMMGVSKATAQRTIDGLVADKIVYKKVGEIKLRGFESKLKHRNLGYGTFIHNAVVYTKSLNSYVF